MEWVLTSNQYKLDNSRIVQTQALKKKGASRPGKFNDQSKFWKCLREDEKSGSG